MKKFLTDHITAIVIVIISWVILSYALYFYQINTQLADTTFIAQILENFRHSLVMNTTMGNSIIESMDAVWGMPAETVCKLPLASHFTNLPWFHYYFALYLLTPFIWIMNIPALLAIIQAGIYLSVIIFTYLYARKKEVSKLNAILLVLLVAQHPLWIEGIYGQFYVNRLFLPFSALFIWLIEKKKISYPVLGIAGLLAISTNEIYGIAIATIIISYLWIHKLINKKLLFFASIYILYSVISIALIQHNLGLTLPQTDFLNKTAQGGIGTTINRVVQDLLSQKTQIFLWVNFAGLGIFTIFASRTLLPLLMVLMPNLLINIGGAEKTGWSTHYHASYFIPLIWFGILGISRLNKHKKLQSTCLVGLIVLAMCTNPYTGKLRQTPIFSLVDLYQKAVTSHTASTYNLDFRRRLNDAIGSGRSVSLLEPVAYHLYHHETYYYPDNIEGVENVILRFDKTKNGDARFSSISYGSQFDPKMDVCIFERMKKDGYNFDNPIIVDGWAVIKRD